MSNEKTGTNRLSSQGDSGYRTSMGAKRDYLNDGHYYAQGDGSVTDYPKGQSQLDQLGKASGGLGRPDEGGGGRRPGHGKGR